MYYYVVGRSQGRGFRSGPYNSEKDAYTKGISFCGADFEVLAIDTRDNAEAGRRIKHILAERGLGMAESLKRQSIGKTTDNI